MALTPGQKLGGYEVLSLLGKGGMGEVYRARDSKLKRDVAVKILPDQFSRDPERISRFQREAEVLASLNHPAIAHVYGLEEAGTTRCIVMELVEGDTLADRLKRGPVLVDEAIRIARQVAAALEAAHDKGIVHRDLKPANIKLTSEHNVKVLDFGLAKMLESTAGAGNLSESPTLSAAHTMNGVILGTAGYMSPEQARGRPVDRRTDIWAFGCVLYELLTGQQAFNGDTTTDIISAIVKLDPDWQALTADAARVRGLLRRCLQKDLNKRLQHIADARVELDEMISAEPDVRELTPAPSRKIWPLAGWVVAAAAIGVAVWGLTNAPSSAPPAAQPVERLSITVPKERPVALTSHALLGVPRPSIAISPDGQTLVYVADVGPHTQLYLRRLDSFEVKAIPKTEGAFDPFFSPDGRWIGFFAEDKLKKVSIESGEPTILSDARNPQGGSWSSDNKILFSDSEGSQLLLVSPDGGPAKRVSLQIRSSFPTFLPDGKSALLRTDSTFGSRIVLVSLDSGVHKFLLDGGGSARYVDTGHILFMRGSSLLAVPFDLAGQTVKGSAEVVLEGIRTEQYGQGQLTVSGSGTLIYVRGGQAAAGTLGWVDRRGAFEPLNLPAQVFGVFQISRDSRRLAFSALNPVSDIWIYDFNRAASTRLTNTGKNGFPSWTLDDKQIAFTSDRAPGAGIFLKAADGTGREEQLVSGTSPTPDAWSPDGKFLAFADSHPGTSWDISILPLTGDRQPQPFLNSQFAEWGPAFSPDGRYIAYISDESGRYEIYVQPFPEKNKKWQISTEGGEEPVWSRDGRELFYRYGRKWMAADIQMTPEFKTGKPHLLFEGPYLNVPGFSYDAAADGKRFLVIRPSDEVATTTELSVVRNWFEELKRRVPSTATR